MAIGKYFKDLTATTDIDALLGAAEKADGSPPGNKFTYSKTPDKTTPSDGKVLTEGGVSDWATYTNPLPTTKAGDGIPAGSTFFNSPQSYADFIEAAYYAYINPAFTSFAITGVSTQEVGQKIVGNQTFTWAISTVGNVQANSINIYDTILPQTLVSAHSVTSPVTFDFNTLPGGGVELDVPGTYTWQIEGINTQLATFTRNLNISWMWRVHSGMNVNTTLTNAQILALANSSLTTVFPPQVTFAGGGYFWYWVPSTFVQPTIFKNHATGFAIAMETAVTQTVTNAFSIDQSYKGYRSTESLVNALTVDVQ